MFAAANVVAMFALPDWQTVPFHFIWVSLTVLYSIRLWNPWPTTRLLAGVALVTGATVAVTGDWSSQRLNELAEVPLMSAMFMVMVGHARRRQQALRQVTRAAERERDFVRDASHQLRTPITVARGHAELIRTATTGTQAERDAEVVIEELSRLERTSDHLLILAASEHPASLMLQPVQLAELVRSAAERWSAIPERQWEFDHGTEARLLADRDRLDCALDALIDNAVHATGAGDRIAVRATADGNEAMITIADGGPGISPEHLDRIFDRFARLPETNGSRNGGTGLGLPMVKAIVEAHQGTVSVVSAVGQGTTFELHFPGVDVAESPAAVTSSELPGAASPTVA